MKTWMVILIFVFVFFFILFFFFVCLFESGWISSKLLIDQQISNFVFKKHFVWLLIDVSFLLLPLCPGKC